MFPLDMFRIRFSPCERGENVRDYDEGDDESCFARFELTRWPADQARRTDKPPGTFPKRTSPHHSQSIDFRPRPLREDNWWPGIVEDPRCPDQTSYTQDNRCTKPHRNWRTYSPGIGYKRSRRSLKRRCQRDRLDKDRIHPQRIRRDNRVDIRPLEVRYQVDIAGLERELVPGRIGLSRGTESRSSFVW